MAERDAHKLDGSAAGKAPTRVVPTTRVNVAFPARGSRSTSPVKISRRSPRSCPDSLDLWPRLHQGRRRKHSGSVPDDLAGKLNR
jgi:hypothetical protein